MKTFSKELVAAFAAVCAVALPLRAIESQVPPGLEMFSLMNVLEIRQDSIGSMWLNTTRGLYRYNGHSLDRLSEELPRRSLSYPGGRYLYAAREGRITRFDTGDLSAIDFAPGEVPAAEAEVSGTGTDVLRTSYGALVAGIDGGGFSVTGPGGQSVSYRYCGSRRISSVRGIEEMEDGIVYIGTANGLYSYSPDGVLKSEAVASIESCPVCCLFKDRDGRLWIGTYHNGVFVSNPSSSPFRTVGSGLRGLMTNATLLNDRGVVQIFTDGQGVLEYDTRSGALVENGSFAPAKYQGAYFDSESGSIWTVSFREGLTNYSIAGRLLSQVRFDPSLGVDIETITPVCRSGADLLVGGSGGLFAFRPGREKQISRKIGGIEGLVYSFTEAPDGKIWIASGTGIYTYSDGIVEKVIVGDDPDGWENTQPCYGIDFSPDGGVWICYARKGVVFMQGDICRYYNVETAGLQDDYTYAISALDNGITLVSTASGLSVIGTSVLNYPLTMVDAIQPLDPDRLLLCARGGVLLFNGKSDIFSVQSHDVRIDRVLVDGARFSGADMKYDQNNIAFDITTFSYSPATPAVFSTILEGFDEEWSRMVAEGPVLYRKLPPGRYNFRVIARTMDGSRQSEDSFPFRIHPPWYSTTAARIAAVLLALLIAGTLFYYVSARRSLATELRRKEAENRERTRFFINLSYRIRTPLNLIVSKLERYFKDFGSRSAGSENIEDIYHESRLLREMISDFVDSQNESRPDDGDPLPEISKDAKFYNAAIGVVERNLFSPDLDVTLLCSEMNVGKTMLTQRLKRASGMTPRVFIETVRLEHAAEMLRQGTHRITEIADLLCFCSAKHFSERFRLKYGCNPSAYK